MKIRAYDEHRDEVKVLELITTEGDEWACYWAGSAQARYRLYLANSITYVAVVDDEICGYFLSLDDNGFYIYVCYFLVRPGCWGKSIGRKLMEVLLREYTE